MTEKQLKLLQYIKDYYAVNRTPPSLEEIKDFDGTSRQNVTQQLKKLAIMGYLDYVRAGLFVPTKKRLPVDNSVA